ncbi:hypothetical protein ANRL2_02846 [Anaerolineae bacterium]|nr:hypothetical protein ANRL2_02846 [Anaerolineae bacterium]
MISPNVMRLVGVSASEVASIVLAMIGDALVNARAEDVM